MPNASARRRAAPARWMVLALPLALALPTALLALRASPAHADPPTPRRLDPTGGPTYWYGNAGQLPNHPGVTESEILAHAFTMPAVQELLGEAATRGYQRHPESDRGFVRSDPRMVGAFLALEKPGYTAPPGEFGSPILYVTTTDVYGTPRTVAALTFLLADETTGVVRTADEEPSLPHDGTVEYGIPHASGGGGGRHLLHPETEFTPLQKACTQHFVFCASTSAAGCVVQSLWPPEPTQVKVIRILLCAAASTLSCLGDFFQCLDNPQ